MKAQGVFLSVERYPAQYAGRLVLVLCPQAAVAAGPDNGAVHFGRKSFIILALMIGFAASAAAADPAIVLQPGTYLRLDPAGKVRVLDATVNRPFVQLDAGGFRLQCSENCRAGRVNVAVGDVLVTVIEKGEYHFDREHDRVLVVEGKMVVRAGDRRLELSSGEVLLMDGQVRVGKVGPVRRRF